MDRSANKSLKYESKCELKWEKGGPGLVHYMDEFAWRQHDSIRKDEFFNEPGAFDWGIDTEHLEEGITSTTFARGTLCDTVQLMQMQGADKVFESVCKTFESL